MPVIVTTAIILVAAYWRFDAKFYAGLAIMLSLNFLNVYYSIADRVIGTPWGQVHSRSDEFDTFRWCSNLLLDVYLLWCFELPTAVAAFTWLILSFGALTEVYRQRNKLITMSVAISGFAYLVYFIYPTDPITQFYLTFAYTGLLFVLWKLESHIVSEMTLYMRERIERESAELNNEHLLRQASVGESARALSHEVSNLVLVGKHTLQLMDEKNNASEKHQLRLQKTFDYLDQVSHLVLDEIGQNNPAVHNYSLGSLAIDLRLLVNTNKLSSGPSFYLDIPKQLHTLSFTERAGSTYLILHNLVKNAHEAIQRHHDDIHEGKISITTILIGENIEITVDDNGGGMLPETLDNIMQQAQDNIPLGHGLGFKFVLKEARKNGFKLSAESTINIGTTFKLTIPIN